MTILARSLSFSSPVKRTLVSVFFSLFPLTLHINAQTDTNATGMQYTVEKVGTGDSPKLTDSVILSYRAFLPGDKKIDDSAKYGGSIEVKLPKANRCWQAALVQMKPGSSAHIVCPPALTYGLAGNLGAIPPDTAIIFDLDLLRVISK